MQGNYGSVKIDLSKYFTDAESPTLTYEATSSDKTIASLNTSATTNLITGGGSSLTVTAKRVGTSTTATSGMATITVEAHDGVNDAVSTSFDVVVVTSNTAPRVTLLEGIEDLVDRPAVAAAPAVPALSNKLYKADGMVTRAFRAAIEPGSVGAEAEMTSLRAIVGNGKAMDALVSVTAPVSTGGNAYSISITALNPSVPVDRKVTVNIFAADSFGAETLVVSFLVQVNTPPSVIRDLSNVVLSRGSAVAALSLVDSGAAITVAPAAEAFAIIPSEDARRDVVYTLSNYFGFLELDTVTITGDVGSRTVSTIAANRGDTTCSYTSAPSQPTGRRERKAVAATTGSPVAVAAIAADPVTATTLAEVNNGRIADTDGTPAVVRDAEIELLRTMLKDSETRDTATDPATAHLTAMVVVDAAAVNLGADNAANDGTNDGGINADVAAAGLGTFTLTITCEDPDARVSSSARITVQS